MDICSENQKEKEKQIVPYTAPSLIQSLNREVFNDYQAVDDF